MRVLLPIVLLTACRDDGLKVYNSAPEAIITSPVSGTEFAEGDTITFEGKVSDDSPLTDLQVEWRDSAVGVLEEGSFVDASGMVTYITSTLEPGEHTVVLRAYDTYSEVAEALVEISVVDVPDKPAITILHPDLLGVEKGLQDNPFIFMVEVSDYQDPAEDLTVELLASPSGLVCAMTPDGSGVAQCPGTLPLGMYTLTFTVTDTDGNSSTANAPFSVVTREDYDMDGDGHTPNGGDCNDSAPTVYPGAPELCDGLDNDCNDLTAIDVGTECYDDDGDGYCETPPCVNAANTLADCDDADPSTYPNPAIPEVVNGVDDDCDTFVDEGTTVYDDDGDGYCETPPCVNTANSESDCHDGVAEVSPGEDEICSDGVDNDCDGYTNSQDAIGCEEFFYDGDSDTYGVSGATECWCDQGVYPYTGLDATDCYDSNANAYPGQPSYFTSHRGDGDYDYNCDNVEDTQYQGATTGCAWDFEPFSCDLSSGSGDGWSGADPACGKSGTWTGGCDGTYDALCIFFCAAVDPALCTSCWSCDPDSYSLTQACR